MEIYHTYSTVHLLTYCIEFQFNIAIEVTGACIVPELKMAILLLKVLIK